MALDEIAAMMEDDSWLRDSPPPVVEPVFKSARRARALNIDDLLKDHHKGKNLAGERGAKRTKLSDLDNSDDEQICPLETEKERQFETLVETCEQQVHADGAIVEVAKWGERVFGLQRQAPGFVTPKLGSLALLVLSAARVLSSKSLFEIGQDDVQTDEMAATLLMELLTGDWLLPLVLKVGQCDETVLHWSFHHMVYSNDCNVERSACDFLCRFLVSRSEIRWLPSFASVLTVLKVYGYLEIATEADVTTDQRTDEGFLGIEGPPHNLGSLLKYLTTCCKMRHLHQVFRAQEVESLVVIIATFSLDRRLLLYAILIQECLESMANYFTGEEWPVSCERIALSISRSDREMCNYLRLACCLHGVDNRLKQLQKMVALHLLMKSTCHLVVPSDVWQVVCIFSQIDLKVKEINFVHLYYQLGLGDIWLWSNPLLQSNQSALDSWLSFLKNCSCQISSTDWRPYASKVRNWASLLLQNYESWRHSGD